MLPWHAAGTLSRSDSKRVEDALARDPELARRYALVREEFSETIHLNETLGAPSARASAPLPAARLSPAEGSRVPRLRPLIPAFPSTERRREFGDQASGNSTEGCREGPTDARLA